jgi:GH24 family phage-related lysozyme (muramidase)
MTSSIGSIESLSHHICHVFESLRLTSYLDAAGVWTIGFGHTRTAAPGQTITYDQSIDLFAQDLAPLGTMIGEYMANKYHPNSASWPKSSLGWAALVSFGYNCGPGALRRVLDGSIVVRHGTVAIPGRTPYKAPGFFAVGPGNGPNGVLYGYLARDRRTGKAIWLEGLERRRKLEAAMMMANR